MDSIFESIGPFGRFQKFNMVILGFITTMAALHFYVQIFNVAEPNFFCKTSQNNINSTHNDDEDEKQKCEMWNNYSSNGNNSLYECEFRDSNYNLTVINDWGLICDKQYLIFRSQTIFFMGSICVFINGFVTDKFGRKKTCAVLLFMQTCATLSYQLFVVDSSIFGMTLPIDTKFILYCAYQFMVGFLVYSLYTSAYVIAIEFTNDAYHTLVANLLIFSFVFGEIILLIVFYFTRNWIYTNWFITGFTILTCVLFIIFVPESPRLVSIQNMIHF